MAGAQTTLVQWTPAYWALLESSCHCENNSHIVLRQKRRNNEENENRLYTTYQQLLIILGFLLFLVSGSYAPVVLMPCPLRYFIFLGDGNFIFYFFWVNMNLGRK